MWERVYTFNYDLREDDSMKTKKFMTIVAGGALAVCLMAGCANKPAETPTDPGSDTGSQSTGMANPWVDVTSLEEAIDQAGFSVVLPLDEMNGFEFRVIPGEMIEVISPNGGSVTMRKAVGADDCSGDYNEYPYTAEVNGITLKGQNETEILHMHWTVDGYSYSITMGDPITTENAVEWANVMK